MFIVVWDTLRNSVEKSVLLTFVPNLDLDLELELVLDLDLDLDQTF